MCVIKLKTLEIQIYRLEGKGAQMKLTIYQVEYDTESNMVCLQFNPELTDMFTSDDLDMVMNTATEEIVKLNNIAKGQELKDEKFMIKANKDKVIIQCEYEDIIETSCRILMSVQKALTKDGDDNDFISEICELAKNMYESKFGEKQLTRNVDPEKNIKLMVEEIARCWDLVSDDTKNLLPKRTKELFELANSVYKLSKM